MPERDIVVTEDDDRKLRTLLAGVRERSVRDREHLQQLDDELERARVVSAREIPPDVVTMNSELTLWDLDTAKSLSKGGPSSCSVRESGTVTSTSLGRRF